MIPMIMIFLSFGNEYFDGCYKCLIKECRFDHVNYAKYYIYLSHLYGGCCLNDDRILVISCGVYFIVPTFRRNILPPF
jgi:hypothetical protein